MMTKGIRGAITVKKNSVEEIQSATIELMQELVKRNNIDVDMVSHVIFTMTPDLNAAFPAKFVRVDIGWENVAFMCFNELDVKGALKKCIRVLVVVNCGENFVPEFVYLNEAQCLRK